MLVYFIKVQKRKTLKMPGKPRATSTEQSCHRGEPQMTPYRWSWNQVSSHPDYSDASSRRKYNSLSSADKADRAALGRYVSTPTLFPWLSWVVRQRTSSPWFDELWGTNSGRDLIQFNLIGGSLNRPQHLSQSQFFFLLFRKLPSGRSAQVESPNQKGRTKKLIWDDIRLGA